MHPNATAVLASATRLGLVVSHACYPDGARTAQDAATAIGCSVGQIVKSLIFYVHPADATPEVVLALVSGSNQLDEKRLAVVAGALGTSRADADAVRVATGFPIGGVPPLGLATGVRVFADEDLLGYETVWAAAGTPRDVFSVSPAKLIEAVGATIAALRRP